MITAEMAFDLGFEKAASDSAQRKQNAHRRYMANRSHILGQGKVYRTANAAAIKRKQKAYRRKVKRGIVRPKKRVGSSVSGFSFMQR